MNGEKKRYVFAEATMEPALLMGEAGEEQTFVNLWDIIAELEPEDDVTVYIREMTEEEVNALPEV